MIPIRELFSTRKSEKQSSWADQCIRFIRYNWVPLISQDEAERGMAYLLSYQSMEAIENLFQNTTRLNLTNRNGERNPVNNNFGLGMPATPYNKKEENYLREMRNLGFKPLPVWEKLYNILIAEMKKMGVVLDVRSTDPTSAAKRLQDKKLIEHKNEIESFLSYVYTSIGEAPYRMKDHAARFGNKPDNGNVDKFEAMGLDSKDPTDVDFFMKEFHKLTEEIAVQDIIDNVAKDNQWDLDIEKWVRDLIAKKALASTCYVSNTTGKIMTRYLAPEAVYIYGGGNRQDFNDANAKGYERKVTVKEMLDIFGNSFDMEKEWSRILQAITYTSNIEFTGVRPSYRGFITGQQPLTNINGTTNYTYNDFMNFRVSVGRIEWNSQNQETFGNVEPGESKGGYEDNQSPDGKYPSKARWETPTYKAYYIVMSQFDQILFDFGELEYQDILGSCDMNVWSTICTYKGVGDSLTIQSAQIVDRINEAWYKFIYEMRRAKPRGRRWNYDSLVETLLSSFPDTTSSVDNRLQKIMEVLDSSANEIFKYPVINGETKLVTADQVSGDIPNGMSKESMLWWEIMMNNIQYLSDMIGIAPLREGDPGAPRDSMNNQFKALEYSQSATYYIPDMLTYLFQQMSVKANFFAQDIITYKDYNSMAYKVLEDAVGSDTLEKLESLGKTALHRFGIFVESFNMIPLRQKVDGLIALDVQKGTISTAESLLIQDIKSPKKAYVTLAYFEQRNRKLAEKSQQQQQQAQQQQVITVEQMKQKSEMIKGDYAVMVAKIQAEATQNSHVTNQIGKLANTELKTKGDAELITHEAIVNLQQAQSSTAQNQPTPNIPQPQQPSQQPVTLPPVPTQQSTIQQLKNETQPQNTMQQQAQ